MVVRITSLDWREGWRWSYGLGIQQLELVIEVKEVDTVTKGKNMGEEWRQRPPCEILLLRSSQKKKICQRWEEEEEEEETIPQRLNSLLSVVVVVVVLQE